MLQTKLRNTLASYLFIKRYLLDLSVLVTCFVAITRCFGKMSRCRSLTGLLKPTFKTFDSCKTREQSGRENMMILHLSLLVIYEVASTLPCSCMFVDKHPQVQFLKADFGKFETVCKGA